MSARIKVGEAKSRPTPELLEELSRLTGWNADPSLLDWESLLHRMGAFLELSRTISGTLSIQEMLNRTCQLVADILGAERCTIFLHDPKAEELFTKASMDPTMSEIRFPDSAGIAGHVFQSGRPLLIPDAYRDHRFNPEVDRRTGFLTRDIVTVPVRLRDGGDQVVGAAQALNKREGEFSQADLELFEALLAHAAPALLNARLFEEVCGVRNYNERVLQSMTDGLLTVSASGRLEKANRAAAALLGHPDETESLVGCSFDSLLGRNNPWLRKALDEVRSTGKPETALDVDLVLPDGYGGGKVSVNVAVVQLRDVRSRDDGWLLVLEDLSREKRVLNTMARYMSKEVAERVLENDREVLGGVLQKVTVLFADIRGFTALSERLAPEEVVRLLNDYFTIMAGVIFDHGGVLDKYIGDSLMALFGAPFVRPDDADRAVAAAKAMSLGLDAFNRQLKANGQPGIEIGIGVNSADVVMGNIGSPKRMDFTVIGDGVNLASRLEGANKTYGSRILASEFTIRELRGEFRYREVDKLRVKGKQRPVTIFEVFAEGGHHQDETALADYRKGLESYRARGWLQAARCFERVLERAPQDGVAKMYVERCRQLHRSPPAEEWDGVWRMTGK